MDMEGRPNVGHDRRLGASPSAMLNPRKLAFSGIHREMLE